MDDHTYGPFRMIPLVLRLRARYKYLSRDMIVSVWFVTQKPAHISYDTLFENPLAKSFESSDNETKILIAYSEDHAAALIHRHMLLDMCEDIKEGEEWSCITAMPAPIRVVQDPIVSTKVDVSRRSKGKIPFPDQYKIKIM